MNGLEKFLAYELIGFKDYKLQVIDIVIILLIYAATRFILWSIKKALSRKERSKNFSEGNLYAVFQLIKYVVWVIAIALMLETIGIKITILLAGSAALLVGIGMGLQQTFNDFISGIILLFERSVKVGDILEVDGDVIKVVEIGMRTSVGLNRNEIIITIPNSMITTNKVINWSNQAQKTLFKVNVGVAYGSDVDKVIEIIEQSAKEHPDVMELNQVEGRFVEFGNSSLDFQVLFFSENLFGIEK